MYLNYKHIYNKHQYNNWFEACKLYFQFTNPTKIDHFITIKRDIWNIWSFRSSNRKKEIKYSHKEDVDNHHCHSWDAEAIDEDHNNDYA